MTPSMSSGRKQHDVAREHPLRAVVGRVVDGGESREWRAGMVNKWSREDLPSISDLRQADDERGNGERTVTLDIALDAVVDRLNKDFPKSYDRGGLRGSTWAERERDSALSRAETAEFRWSQMKARAEQAEARTAVTREDVEKALDTGIRGTTDGGLIDQYSSIPSGECVRLAVDAVCHLFGIEAGHPADPVEELARQIETATRAAIRQVCDDLAALAPSLDPLTVEQAMEVTAASRKVAAHVLREEA